jgi:hypothetical protein
MVDYHTQQEDCGGEKEVADQGVAGARPKAALRAPIIYVKVWK